jgi:hypothetical protein
MTSNEAEEIYKFLMTDGKIRTLEEFKAVVCDDVSEGKVLVKLRYNFYHGGSFKTKELLDVKYYEMIPRDAEINLGEVNGKHSEVIIPLRELVESEITDPYDIAKNMETEEIQSDYLMNHLENNDYYGYSFD